MRDGDESITSNGGTGAQPVDVPAPPAEEHVEPAVLDLEDRLRRALADVDNLRKRYARELTAERAAERARVCAQWLPVIDNLELALGHAAGDDDPVIQGVRAVRDQAVALLAMLGFPRYGDTGVPFDPRRHEAVATRPDPEVPPGTVLEVLRPGYGDGDRQLRPAAVAVAARAGGE
jgi:molecular chaperone GrpE